ncbi:MAG TPA: MarR family transcriptional regulator [Candidatus Bathyarchaeia archaeon]|nr:MarR family transcriptional regulator [Candidatus Bathyarchaeia archaeon]
MVKDNEMNPVRKNCDLSASEIERFREVIYKHYQKQGRILPWRLTCDPYKILVSELMLQQTQAGRVGAKYESFLREFPNFAALSRARLQNVLGMWHGLGYNRRALALKRTAEIVDTKFGGMLPSDYAALVELPGVGRTTACAIRAFAFDAPEVFIETNIRAVFIHFFFVDGEGVKDDEIYPLVECTLDRPNPRAWYYALMDYGVMLKKRYKNPSRQSAHHKRQAPFKHSNRQLRGQILALIVTHPGMTETELLRRLNADSELILRNLKKLEEEGFFKREQCKFVIG